MASTFLKAQGVGVGASLVEDDQLETARAVIAEAEAARRDARAAGRCGGRRQLRRGCRVAHSRHRCGAGRLDDPRCRAEDRRGLRGEARGREDGRVERTDWASPSGRRSRAARTRSRASSRTATPRWSSAAARRWRWSPTWASPIATRTSRRVAARRWSSSRGVSCRAWRRSSTARQRRYFARREI